MNNGKVKLVEYFLSIVVLFQVVKLITVNVSLNNIEKKVFKCWQNAKEID